jgi:hypothetical protein
MSAPSRTLFCWAGLSVGVWPREQARAVLVDINSRPQIANPASGTAAAHTCDAVQDQALGLGHHRRSAGVVDPLQQRLHLLGAAPLDGGGGAVTEPAVALPHQCVRDGGL